MNSEIVGGELPLEPMLGVSSTVIVGLIYRAPEGAHDRTLRARWRRHVMANAAPRDREYMEALFRRHFPSAQIVEATGGTLPHAVLNAEASVLLYPDAIGLDFGRLERQLREDARSTRLLALNGRGRLLPLDAATRHRLRFRRFLAWTRLPEFVFLTFFVVATPALAFVDLLKGRR